MITSYLNWNMSHPYSIIGEAHSASWHSASVKAPRAPPSAGTTAHDPRDLRERVIFELKGSRFGMQLMGMLRF